MITENEQSVNNENAVEGEFGNAISELGIKAKSGSLSRWKLNERLIVNEIYNVFTMKNKLICQMGDEDNE